jgi:hypothetical protein
MPQRNERNITKRKMLATLYHNFGKLFKTCTHENNNNKLFKICMSEPTGARQLSWYRKQATG